jgi:hypothetical protein
MNQTYKTQWSPLQFVHVMYSIYVSCVIPIMIYFPN